MFKKLCIALIATAGLSTTAFAAEDGWSGEASLAGSKTTGNTETTDVGFGLKLEKQAEKWRHKFDATADYGKTIALASFTLALTKHFRWCHSSNT